MKSCATITMLSLGMCIGVFIGFSFAIEGGTKVDRCNFPGLAVVLINNNKLFCQGVVVGGKLMIPSDCRQYIKQANVAMDILITTEKTVWTIKKGTFTSTLENGYGVVDLSKLVVKSTSPGDCFKEGELYDDSSDKLKMDTCVVVGYGPSSKTTGSVVYSSANARSAPITRSTSASCCKIIENTGLPKYASFDNSHHVNCLVSKGQTCGIGDTGSPVMCDTEKGKRVTIALTAATTCGKDAMFVAHDLTKRSHAVKFGG